MVNGENVEYEKLEEIKKKYKEVIEDLRLSIRSLNSRQAVDPDALYNLIRNQENTLRVITEGLNKPYFARIDFKNTKDSVKDICYIGKVGVSDFDNNIVTVDWRAPIASLYYDSNLGMTSYKAPDGIIDGQLTLKRQYEIENGELISFNDVDIVSNDEILKPYLDVNADNRLKNIVSSIQDEQNQVIRKDLSENLIVQGVAGSGKTTVALHRIAYLAYNYRDKIKSDQYVVIGPNKFFINYISQVLPDLDVTDVLQVTYEEFVKEFLQEEFRVIDTGKILGEQNINKFKLSMDYKDLIDQYVDYLDKNLVLPKKDFVVKGFKILPIDFIQDIYCSIDNAYFPNIEAKIDRLVLLVSTQLREQDNKIITMLMEQLYDKLENAKDAKEKEKIKKDYDVVKKELQSTGFTASLKKFITFRNKNVTSLYTDFLKQISSYNCDSEISSIIKNNINKDKSTYMIEDLPGLSYLGCLIKNPKDFKKYRHTVIDEAQDYGDFNFYVLKQILPNSSFSIFGDLAQSIYDYRSIDNWEEVIDKAFDGDCNLEYLLKSYRTTIEIMNSANEVLDYIGLKTAEPVIRHGCDVKFTKINDNCYKQLLNIVKCLQDKNYNSIALISRDDNMSHLIKEELAKLGLDISEITIDNQDYDSGICSISSSLAKGLEFDAVVITDASEEKYSSNNNTDMKNLYVSMTRPLHELEILYNEPLSKPLQKCLKK